jgi:hypothetical protein
MAAIAAALQHLNLAWAFVGFFLRLPIINQFAQVISDGAIAEPRPVKRTPAA